MEQTPAATLSLGPKTVRVSPGTTAIVEVAIDHLNRIVTPFAAPQVRTVSSATTQVDGNAVYVATASEEPVSLFITEAGDTATAISLTLAPRHIPPREVRLVLTGALARAAAAVSSRRETVARDDQPYVEHIAATFPALAQNRVPAGFSLRLAARDERRRLITNLLTDADPRAIGIEGLAERLRRLETHMGQLSAGLDKLGLTKGADPERDALIARPRQENARELQELRRQQEALREQLAAGGAAPALPAAAVPQPPAALPTQKPSPAPRAQRLLTQLFDQAPEPPSGPPGMARLPGVGSEPAHGAKALTIRLVAAEEKAGEGHALPEDAVLIPAGSILRGVLLSGTDAPTGRQSRRDPYPALARIKHDAILPNRFRADVRECFLVLAGYGDLGSERAYLRTEAITCVRQDGGAIEVPIDAYATGEDGKVGERGRVS
jgi:hypothetical protein